MAVSDKINECYRLISRNEREAFFHSIAQERQIGENIGSLLELIQSDNDFFIQKSSILYAFAKKTSTIMNDLYIGITEELLKQPSKESKELFISDVFLLLNLLEFDIKEEMMVFIAALDEDEEKYKNLSTYPELNEYLYADYGYNDGSLFIILQINYLQDFLKTVDAFLFSFDRRFGHYVNEVTKNRIQALKTEERVYHVYPNTRQHDVTTDTTIDTRRLVWNGLDSELTELTIALIQADLIKFEKGKNQVGEVGAAFLKSLLHKDDITPQKYFLNIKDVRRRKNDREKILIPKLEQAFDQYMKEGSKNLSKKEE